MLVQSVSVLLALLGTAALAQMVDCPGISNDGYKVILDGIRLTGPGNQDANLLLSRLQQKVQFDLAAMQLETTPQTLVVPCVSRAPKDFSEFNPTVVDSLNGHRVLVEIWGNIEAKAGVTFQQAELHYTLVPISLYDQFVVPQYGFVASYRQRLGGRPDELVKLFGEFSDLKAYVSIAAGVKSLKEHHYDQAYHCFCRAGSMLGQAPSGMNPAVRTSLLNYLSQKVGDTFTQARADKSVKSSLGLDGMRPVCPGALP